jgi:hypothetical protein
MATALRLLLNAIGTALQGQIPQSRDGIFAATRPPWIRSGDSPPVERAEYRTGFAWRYCRNRVPYPCGSTGRPASHRLDHGNHRDVRQNIGLQVGAPFRGMIATIDAVEAGKPGDCFEFHNQDRGLQETGNDHRTAGLWRFDIPTLFRYHTFTSPPYYLLLTDFLSDPVVPNTGP